MLLALAAVGAIAVLVAACAERSPEDPPTPAPAQDRQGIGDSLPLPRVTVSSARVDLDGDRATEAVEIRADVALGPGGEPLWEDGHRWTVLIRDGSEEHRLVDEFVPQGRLSGWVVEPEEGSPVVVVLRESGTSGIAIRAFRSAGGGGYVPAGAYDGAGRLVARLAEGELTASE